MKHVESESLLEMLLFFIIDDICGSIKKLTMHKTEIFKISSPKHLNGMGMENMLQEVLYLIVHYNMTCPTIILQLNLSLV